MPKHPSELNLEIELSDKQLEFEKSLHEFDVTGYGGAKGGGKSAGARLIGLLGTLETPGMVTGLFRRSFVELKDNHLGPLFRQFPELRGYYNSTDHEIRIPSLESSFKFRYCENMSDVDRQAGREYHRLLIEEAGDWQWQMILGLIRNCNRSSVPGIRPSTGLAFNWGGIGHSNLKRVFIDKRLHENEKELSFKFILAKVEDNPKLIENDPGYLRRLESEPNPQLRRAYRHGDPDIVAGQYFTDLSRDIHLVTPFEIPAHWQRFGSYDYGFGHPAVACWFAVDEDGCVYLYRAFAQARMKIKEFAEEMNRHPETAKIIPWWAGHDCWARRGTAFGESLNQPTIAEEFAKYGIFLRPANIDRVQGWRQVRDYLSPFTDAQSRLSSNFKLFNTPDVRLAFDSLARCAHDPDHIEDVLKVDAENGDPETGDDHADCVRYGLMSRPLKAKPVKKDYRDPYKRRPPQSTWATV